MSEYFTRDDVVASMADDHLFLWLTMLAAVRRHLAPGCRVLDLGCSSGALLRLLWSGVPGLLEPVCPSLGVGLEPETARSILAEATARTPVDLPILYSCAPLEGFPGQFDVILSHEVIYLLPDLDRTFSAAHAALRAGGILCAATAGYVEHEYYRRWLPRYEALGIPARGHSKTAYLRGLQGAGFDRVDAWPLRLAPETYSHWRAQHPYTGQEGWFESADDERRYFTEVGKLVFVGIKAPQSTPQSY